MNKKSLIIGISVIAAILFISSLFSSNTNEISKRESIVSAVSNTAELDIKGLTCASCAYAARTVLEGQEGVISAEVDVESGKALVKYDGDKITPQQLANLINENTSYVASLPDDSLQTSLN